MAHTKVTKTYSQNTGAANTFSYSGSFDVFKGTEVQVELDNTQLTFTASTINESASPREYTVDTSAKTIHIGGADLSSGTIIIRPVTDMGDPTPRATYAPGSSVTSEDLNNNQTQLMRKAMEYDEQKLSSLGGTMTGHLTMGEDQTIIFEGATDDGYETTLTVTDPTADRTITLPNVTGTVVTTGDTATVTATMLAANSVDSSELVDGSINTSHISSGAVTTAKLAADVVTGAKIADDAIDSEHYTDGSIDTAHIADANITTAKLADNAVTTAKITDGNVTTAKIAADAITAAKIADDVVNSEHIAAGAVDLEHMSANSVDSDQYVDGSIDTAHIADLNVTTAKIAADAITGAKIADDAVDSEHYTDGSIDTAHIADLNVTTAKIAADAITGAKIADDAIDSEHYTDGSIDTAHIGGTQVTAAKIASNAVTTAKITDANVTTAKIADDAITIAKVGCEQTTISDSDSHIPTSGAVVDYVAAQIAPIGGLEVIADEDNFPSTQPASGVVISIADAAGIVVSGSGSSTTARTAGNGSDNVTINNFPSSLYSETLASGNGLMVTSTGSSNVYNYHKLLASESDVKQLSDDINDFNSRYRINAGEPGSNNDEGDLVYDTAANKMKVYDGSSWGEVTSTGDFKYLVMTNSGTTNAATLNGSNITFDLKETSTDGSAASVTSAAQLLVSVNGVVQKANTGTTASGLDGFVMSDADTITFCAAPASGDDIFIVQFGSALSPVTPADGTVVAAKIGSGAVTTAKIADDAVTAAKIGVLDASLHLADATNLLIGTGSDLKLWHYSDHSYIRNETGNLTIEANGAGDDAIKIIPDGAVELYHDNSKKLETTSGGITLLGHALPASSNTYDLGSSAKPWRDIYIQNDFHVEDDGKIIVGDGDDLEIYHNGSDSYIRDTGTGSLKIDTSQLLLRDGAGSESMITATANGAVECYYDSNLRALTTANGFQVQQAAGADVEFRIKNSANTDGDATNYILSEHDGRTTAKIVFGRNGDSNDFSASAATTQGDIQFFTTASGTTTKRARFNNTGYFHADADSGTFVDCDSAIHAFRNSSSNWALRVINSHASAPYGLHSYFNNSHPDDEQSRFFQGQDDQTSRVIIYSNGDIENHDNSYGQTSDIKLKENIADANSQWDDIKAVRVRNFNFKIDDPSKRQIGVIAQELETVSPKLITTHKDLDDDMNDLGTTTKSVKYSVLYMKAIKALQEAMAKIETLETKVAALEAK